MKNHDESFAIADMRDIPFSEPHYHPEVEIYLILQGSALIVVGKNKHMVNKGDELIIPANIAHFTVPNDCVMAIINIPPFNADHYVVLTESNPSVFFDYVEFARLTKAQG